MPKQTSIMIVGVGGQGTLLASRIIGEAVIEKGYDIKMSEVHGMAQRGGSVVTYVKYGDKIFSPIIPKGEADIIISFEELEAMRWADYLKKDGTLIVNKQQIDPMPVIIGAQKYPEEIIEKLDRACSKLIAVDALELAKKAGSIKTVNVVLLGVLSKYTDINKESWLRAITQTVPSKFLDMNKLAFKLGYSLEGVK